MNDQINYITKLAEQYKVYFEQPKELFTALNQLSQSSIETIYKEYGDSDRDFQPVNLLRAEVARGLLECNEVTKDLVAKIKQKIRTKDIGFFSHLSEKFLEQIEKHKIGKRDIA